MFPVRQVLFGMNCYISEEIYTTKVFIKATAVLLGSDFSVNSHSCDINSPFNKLFFDRQLQFDPNMTLSSCFLLASGNNNHFQYRFCQRLKVFFLILRFYGC